MEYYKSRRESSLGRRGVMLMPDAAERPSKVLSRKTFSSSCIHVATFFPMECEKKSCEFFLDQSS